MTIEPDNPTPLRRAWSKRWVRRLTYLLASGAAVAGLTAWAVQQPMVDRWLVGKLDEVIRRETGLGFAAERLEIHPFQGRVRLYGPALGEDLFQAKVLEVEVDPYSFLKTHHVRRILIESPRLNVDAARLSAIHLRPRPETAEPPTWRLDKVEVSDGVARVDEPAWGVRHAVLAFEVDGRGRLPQQVWFDVRVPSLALGESGNRLTGNLSLKFRATDKGLDTANLQAHLGDSALAVLGSIDFPTQVVKADVTGALDLGEALRLLPGPAPASGFVDFKGKVQGPVLNPVWNGVLAGRQLTFRGAPLRPGVLQASADGAPGRLRLEKADWSSPEGRISAEGGWTRQGGTTLDVTAEGVSLTPAAAMARTELLKGLTARFRGSVSMPSAPWAPVDLGKVAFTGAGAFLKEGRQVGTVDLALAGSRLRATDLELTLPEAAFHGSGAATLRGKGLAGLEAEGDVTVDASEVADSLFAWKTPKERLDMSGATRAHATVQWSPRDGFQLDGHAQVEGPRWHGAHADRVVADLTIRGDVLRITDIELWKGEGHGTGDIWITWADGPPDAKGIDMCFSAFRLPVEEGLRAADQGDLLIAGTGSGWARLYGPLDAIVMEGQVVAETATVYGLQVPAASANFSMDINNLRIRATEVRVADTLDHLEGAAGPLDLRGSMDLDAERMRWDAELKGTADSALLGLKGPLLRGRVAGRLEGPLTAPLGPSQAPEGVFTLEGGHFTLGDQNLEGVQGRVSFQDGRLEGRLGLEAMGAPFLTFEGLQAGSVLTADLAVRVASSTAPTQAVSARASQGFLKDLDLDFRGAGAWSGAGLTWQGTLQTFTGVFDGFQLTQDRPGTFKGGASGMELALDLEGRATSAAGAPSPASTAMGLAGWVPFGPQGALDLKLQGSAELANLKAIVDHLTDPGQYSLMSDLKPAGTATFNLLLGGRPAEPSLEGRLDLRGGRLTARTYPQTIEHVDFTAYFHNRDITIPQDAPLRGTLAQGDLAAWGKLTWGFRGINDYDLSATLEDFQFRDLPEGFEIQGGFNGTLKGNDRYGGLLKGSIRAKHMLYQADLNLTDLILGGVLGGGGGLKALDPSDPLARIELDLDLQLTRPWEVDTNLLKVQGNPTGAFKILGNLAHPGLKGRMELLPGGRLTNLLPAGDLVLEKSSVEFTDPAVFNPILDLHGRVDVDPYLVTLDIGGTLDGVNAHPSSTPALRPDEIFAILVDPSAVTKVGATQSAPSQTTVSTGIFNQGAGLFSSLLIANGLDRLRKTLGLDRVNFAYSGTANLSLTLEKSWEVSGHRLPVIYNYKQEGTQTTNTGYFEFRFGNLVLQLGARQVTGSALTPGDPTIQGVQPSGEIRYTWNPK